MISPFNMKELQQYLDENNLDASIAKFKLEVEDDSVGLGQFGIDSPQKYKITCVFDCERKEDKP